MGDVSSDDDDAEYVPRGFAAEQAAKREQE
jgi:hypothetical protein